MTTATATELWRLGAGELAHVIRSREASSREVVEAHLRRIEAVNPRVNAVTVLLADRALEEATAADRALAAGGALPPLLGVPCTIKGNVDLAGTPTTHGIRALAQAEPGIDAPAVARLRAAGAIPLGHTNLPDFAIGWHCDSELWGATVNPWDPARTPGGSSGGEAAALATGMTPLGLGNDTGASLRWPAQCCGIAVLKPSLGRIPHDTAIEPRDLPIGNQLMGVNGPMARRVADLRVAFEAMAWPSWRDPWTVPAPLRGPALATPIRVALVTDPAGLGVAPQVRDGVRRAASALEDAGYPVDEVEPPQIELATRTWLDISVPSLRTGWQLWGPMVRAETMRFVTAFFEVAGEQGLEATIQGLITRQSVMRAWAEFQEVHPLIVAPVATDLPFEVGQDRTTADVGAIVRAMRMALAVNTLSLPAVALPVGVAEGLPQAIQIIGPRYREDVCLDAAAALEDRVGIVTPIDPA
jgi:amidase